MASKFLQEFKTFAVKGNAIDMAVGVITGSILTGVVNSLVKDIIMPPIGVLLGGVDFSNWFMVIGGNESGVIYHTVAAANAAGVTTINFGLFLNAIISFIITMFAVFLFVKMMNRMNLAGATTMRTCPYCQTKTVSVAATKCPYCCSTLKPVVVNAPAPVGIVGGALSGVKSAMKIGEKMGKKITHGVKKLAK